MKQDFYYKLDRLIPYCDRFQRVTFFELTQYFGASCFLLLIMLMSLALFLTSSQWITLPFSALCIMCAIWYFFDNSVWLPDSLKAKSIASARLKKYAVFCVLSIEKWRSIVKKNEQFDSFWYIFGPTSVLLMGMSAFAIGFAQSPSFLPVCALFLLPLGLLIEDVYITWAGYLFFVLEVVRAWW